MIYNEEQEKVIQGAVDHVKYGGWKSDQIYQISGKPGTGKTEVLMEIIRRIGIPLQRVAPMAYVGQAASVMRTRGLVNAKTIHSWLYKLTEVELLDELGKPIIDEIFNKPKLVLKFLPIKLDNIDYIIVDEASTVPMRMRADIERQGLPIIAVGDLNQLPPVKDKPAFLVGGEVHYLTQIMRQHKDSGIVYLSELILNDKPISCGLYGKDALVIEEKDLTDQMLENAFIVLCGTNKTRDRLNKKIRNELFGIYNDVPQHGEKIICRKNNWNIEIDGISLTNGLIGSVTSYPTVEQFDGDKFYIDFKPDLIQSYYPHLGCNYNYFNGNYDQRMLIKSTPYTQGELFEPANVITTHLSQGGQYPNGVYIQEYLSRDIQKHLNYTGVTRFQHYMIYVIPNRKIFA